MTLAEFSHLMEKIAPLELQEDFDHSGIQCGAMAQEIDTVLLALDCTEAVVEEAISIGAQLIVTHHPLLFHPIQDLGDRGYVQRILRKLVQHDIALYAAHTNLDNADGGVCDALAQALGLKNICKMVDCGKIFGEEMQAYGRVGEIEPVSLAKLAREAKEKLQAPTVAFAGDPERKISRLAVASGSGSSCMERALEMKADCLLTGEIKHAAALEYTARGLCLIDAGHYATEKVVLSILQEHLQSELFALKWNVRILCADADRNVFSGV